LDAEVNATFIFMYNLRVLLTSAWLRNPKVEKLSWKYRLLLLTN